MGINSIKVKKVIRSLDLGDFQEEYRGTIIEVWVNPPVSVKFALPDLLAAWQKAIAKRLLLEKSYKEEANLLLGTMGFDPKQAQFDIDWKVREKTEVKPGENAPESEEQLESGTPEVIENAKEEEQKAKRALYEWFSEVWEDSPIEDVMTMVEKLEVEDPALLMFMRDRTVRMVNEYYIARKKA